MLRNWIAAGCPTPPDEKPEPDPREHWAFRPLVRPPVPAVANPSWVRNPIDAFIAARHEQAGLVPKPEPPRHVLVSTPPSAERPVALSVEPTPIVDVAAVSPMPKAGGVWSLMEVSARGDVLSVVFNGQKTVDAVRNTAHTEGPLALQYGSGVVKFRAVEVRTA